MSISYGDKSLETLRSLITIVDRELPKATASPELQAAWDDMVKTLALGPAPQLRQCPRCNASAMRAATRCSSCWVALEALP